MPNPPAEEKRIEVWRPVVGYEGFYEVSNLGHVRSLDRFVTGPPGVQDGHRDVTAWIPDA